MKTIYRLLVLALLLLVCSQCVDAQIIVYNNDFVCPGGNKIPMGTPAVTFSNSDIKATIAHGVQAGGYDALKTQAFTNNQLVLWADRSGIIDESGLYISAPLKYARPFEPVLAANADTITWTFNMRVSAAVNGTGKDANTTAVVLAATSATLTAGDGYAVVYNGSMSTQLQLVRYSGGMQNTQVVIAAANELLAAPTNYASIKVSYDPHTDIWTLFVRDDGAQPFTLPYAGNYTTGSIGKDGIDTHEAMSSFGFYCNYNKAVNGKCSFAYFDNYRVLVSCAPPAGLTANIAPAVACSGARLQLGGEATDAVAYTWVGPMGFSATTANASATAMVSGTYILTATTESGCPAIAKAYVTVNKTPAPPVITPAIATPGPGDAMQLVAVTKNATQGITAVSIKTAWQWYNNGIAIPGATDSVYTSEVPGNYTIKMTGQGACESRSMAAIIQRAVSGEDKGTNNNAGINIRIYPNPAQQQLHIMAAMPVSAQLSSADGHLVMSVANATDIDISALAPGIYMLALYDASGTIVKTDKVVKE